MIGEIGGSAEEELLILKNQSEETYGDFIAGLTAPVEEWDMLERLFQVEKVEPKMK